jgi:hypothetical protein
MHQVGVVLEAALVDNLDGSSRVHARFNGAVFVPLIFLPQ